VTAVYQTFLVQGTGNALPFICAKCFAPTLFVCLMWCHFPALSPELQTTWQHG